MSYVFYVLQDDAVYIRSHLGSSPIPCSGPITMDLSMVMKRGTIQTINASGRNLFITPDGAMHGYDGRNVFVLPSTMASFESSYEGQEVWYKDMASEKIELQGRYTQATLLLTKDDIAKAGLLFKRGKVQAICNRQYARIDGSHLFITPDGYDRNVFVLPSVMDSFGDGYVGETVWYQDEPSEKSGLQHRYTQATMVLTSDEHLSALQNYLDPSDAAASWGIGCDVGNVISIGYDDITDEAIEGVRAMVETVGRDDFYIVSKAKKEQQYDTLALFHRRGFCAKTGVVPRNIRFCQQRETSDYANARALRTEDLRAIRGGAIDGPRYAPKEHGKGSICRLLELACMVDDREVCLLDVKALTTHAAPLLLQPLFSRSVKPSAHRSIRHFRTWDSVVRALRDYVSQERGAASSRKRTMTSTSVSKKRQPTMTSTSPPWKKRRV